MKLAAVTFSPQGLSLCRRLQEGLAELQIYLHDDRQSIASAGSWS